MSLWALNEVRIFRSFLPHIHSHFVYLFFPILVLDIYSVYATANRTHHAPLVAIQTRNRSRVTPYIPMRSLMAFVACSGNRVVPGSSCSIDVLCTWTACAPTGAQDTGNATPAKCRSRGLPVVQPYGLLVHPVSIGSLPEQLCCTSRGNFVLLRS
jgi:hypothetical protein